MHAALVARCFPSEQSHEDGPTAVPRTVFMAIEGADVETPLGLVPFVVDQRKKEIQFAVIFSGPAVAEYGEERGIQSADLLVVREEGFQRAEQLELGDGLPLFPIAVKRP